MILVRVPPKFVGQPYSTLVQHAVDRKLLPVGLSRFPESRKKPYVRTRAADRKSGHRHGAGPRLSSGESAVGSDGAP